MRAHCHRCEHEVEGAHSRPRLRKIAWAYLLLIVPFIPVLPIIASDYLLMIPTLMVYMLGLGPVFAIIREPPSCTECGAMLMRAQPPVRVHARTSPRRARRITQPVARTDTSPP